MARPCSAISNAEQKLLERAAEAVHRSEGLPLTTENLVALSNREGAAFATAWLYQHLRASDTHGPFIEEVEAFAGEASALEDFDATLTIVPGAFYRNYPQSGADGRLIRDAVRDCGVGVELIPTESFGHLEENAERICRWLLDQPPRPRVLVSLCKGSADLKLAFARPEADEAFQQVQAWVDLSGMTYGTPIAPWVLSKPLRRLWYRLILTLQGYDFRVVGELSDQSGSLLSKPLPLPPNLPVVHVLGFPLPHHMTTRLAARCYRRVLHLGPNDGGGVLLSNVCRLPGRIYPVWGADHYLRPSGRDMPRLIRGVLHTLARSTKRNAPLKPTVGPLR